MTDIKKGYEPAFLGVSLPFPKLPLQDCAALIGSSKKEIQYIHYSGFFHKERALPLMTACNIKGEAYNAPARDGGEPWDYSEQIDHALQLDGSFYSNDSNTFDRGHLVRRVDPCWGDEDHIDEAELGTFKWTNCTPQHKDLNRKGGVWFELEQHVMENGVKNKIADISVFAGPVLDKKDKAMVEKKGKYKDKYIQIPTEFWKLIVWKKSDGELYAVAFLMSQWEFIKDVVVDMPVEEQLQIKKAPKPKLADDYFEKLKFKDHKTYQVPVSVIEQKTGISFNWEHVHFPYTSPKATPISGQPVKRRYTFATIQNKRRRMRAVHGIMPTKTEVRRSVAIDEKPLTDEQVERAVHKGYAAAIKRFELKNVTL